jgi:TRAP-type C4-dicarboxylate transport system permease small subunit
MPSEHRPGSLADLGWIDRAELRIARVEELVAMALIAFMAIVVNLEIFARYVFGRPFIWSEEVTRLSLVWMTFIAVPATIRRGGDMVVDTFVGMLPMGLRRWAHASRDVLMIAVYTIVAWEGWRLANALSGMPLVVTDWPSSLIAWPLLLGGLLVILHVALRLLRTAIAIRRHQSIRVGSPA